MSDLTPQTECISDLLIDEALTSELPMATRDELERHMAQCSRCRSHWDDIVREREAFLSNAPSFEALAAKVARTARLPASARTGPWLAGFGAALAATAAIVLILARYPAQPVVPAAVEQDARTSSQQATTIRSKGGPHIGFFIKSDARVSDGQSGAIVHPGDRLRFTYSSDTSRYLALFNLDAKQASVYYPNGANARRVAAGRDVALDFSIELDQTIGREKIFAVFCEAPFKLEPMRIALADNRKMEQRLGCTVDTIQLVKEPAP